MPTFNTEVAHALGQDVATERLKQFLDGVVARYEDQVSDMQGAWADNRLSYSFTAMGFAIRGTLTVEEQLARVEGQIPFAVIPFRGMIEEQMRSELERALR